MKKHKIQKDWLVSTCFATGVQSYIHPSGFECYLGDVVVSPNGYESVVVKSDDDDTWGLLGSTDSFCKLVDCDLTGYKKITKMKVELIQKTTLTSLYYVIRVDGQLHMTYSKYEDAIRDYDKIKTYEQGEQVLNSKEI